MEELDKNLKPHFLKMADFCAYQERAEQEVWKKLEAQALEYEQIQKIIATLKAENYLDERRFVASYIQGKIRFKKWGIYKIKQGLQQKGINAQLIAEGLENKDLRQYKLNLLDLLKAKKRKLKEEEVWKKKQKLYQYALSKGYESALIQAFLQKMTF
ncbi:regulatory protein RecX [Hugenholtzia roseola]|uniref:regulatory protein RecX n=1 Tax=Hugenholtzia roseola TaxID=1002 RepID=UPI00041F92CE|nr:regulatory protein RecX [Hugenholtzia roseola]